ncbi:MAG TPA: hypothetical protein VIF43_02485 [Patescibacteria group bacterium]|jgi:hypothetical protein
MTASEKIGCPEWFQLWDHGPFEAACIVLVAYIGIVSLLMFHEEARMGLFGRSRYLTFLIGGLFAWPAIAFNAALAIEHSGPLDRPFTEPLLHIGLLAAGVLAALIMEVAPLRDGTFTWRQEFSPSKLYHTVVFGPLLYAIVLSLCITFSDLGNGSHTYTTAISSALALVFFAFVAAKDRAVYWTKNKADPHVEWYATRWNGEPRYVERDKRGLRGGAVT